jgi:serine/threonine-protein kinase
MPLDTIDSLIEALQQSRLLTPAQSDQVLMSVRGEFVDPADLADDLVRKRWLTRYQAEQLLLGRGPGLQLGHYVLLEPLGAGGLAQVFTARHRRLDRVDAVKVLRPQSLAHPQALRCFEREAVALARLCHPNVVIIYDAGEADGRHYLAVEHVAGKDLHGIVRQVGPLPVALACDYARQTSLGLQHAFEHEVVHRDVKPTNLRLTADAQVVKILDMGLALLPGAAAPAAAAPARVMGTPDYMAPEQAVAGQDIDIRADLYSLGCTLYFLLTGQPPYPGRSAEQKLLCHHREPLPGLDRHRTDVAPGLVGVLRRLTAKKPAERYQTPAEAAEALQPFCPDEAVRAALGALPPGRVRQ